MKIIITGATGSLGAALTRYFSIRGHEVLAAGRDAVPPKALLTYARYLKIDITRPFELPEADACIHTAALSDDKARASELYSPNVNGTRHTAQASSRCRHFIHVSSSSVYLPEQEPLKEEVAGQQNNRLLSAYGNSKLMAEQALLDTSNHESCFILRPRAFYGAGDRVILPRILKLVKQDVFSRPGSMAISVSLTHYDNFARAIELCLQAEQRGKYIYNVADDQSYILVETIRKIILEIYGRQLPEKEIGIGFLKLLALFKIGGITPLLIRSFTNDMVLDLGKIRKELNYSATVDFDSQLPQMGEWVRKIGGVQVIRSEDKKLAWEI